MQVATLSFCLLILGCVNASERQLRGLVPDERDLLLSSNPFMFPTSPLQPTTDPVSPAGLFGGFGPQPAPVEEDTTPESSIECPISTTRSFCTVLDEDPVVCGPNKCEYYNSCTGFGSGLSDCEPRVANEVSGSDEPNGEAAVEPILPECPVINFVQACTDEPAAVVCGPALCEYDALCTAQAAGFLDETCALKKQCPEPAPLPCPLLLNPVECTNDAFLGIICEYDNFCVAGAADFMMSDCRMTQTIPPPPIPPPEEDPNKGGASDPSGISPAPPGLNNPDFCPERGDSECPEDFRPVLCEEACEYVNLCEALFVDFEQAACEPIPVFEILEPPFFEGNPSECPDVATDLLCATVFDPVRCTNNILTPIMCEYSNQCIAEGADFGPSQCKPIGVVVDPEPAACPRVEDSTAPCEDTAPLVCGLGECFYKDSCDAIAASFDPAEECILVEKGPFCVQAGLSEPCLGGPALLCDDCEYENLCYAEAVGFTERDCELLEEPVFCAVPALVEECPEGPTVLCEECLYDNICLAQAAGFSDASCEFVQIELAEPVPPAVEPLLECPPLGGGICGTVFAPVNCGGCDYSNLCDAESTGVFTDSDCVQLRLPGPVCPEAGDAPCNRMYRPVDCGGCEYSNQCVANSAGFDADSCDELVPPPDISTTLQEPSPCPETGPYFPCNKRYDPVVCVLDSDEDAEPFLCEYSNLCSAIGALFSEEDCRPTL